MHRPSNPRLFLLPPRLSTQVTECTVRLLFNHCSSLPLAFQTLMPPAQHPLSATSSATQLPVSLNASQAVALNEGLAHCVCLSHSLCFALSHSLSLPVYTVSACLTQGGSHSLSLPDSCREQPSHQGAAACSTASKARYAPSDWPANTYERSSDRSIHVLDSNCVC